MRVDRATGNMRVDRANARDAHIKKAQLDCHCVHTAYRQAM